VTRRIPLWSDRYAERARAILDGTASPAEPRDAATVILLRATEGGPEVFLLRRVAKMAFAPGAHVFPGGSADPSDADPDIPWTGPSAAEFGAAFGVPEDRARALVCAAVRETFEECGVLLASPGELTDPSAARQALARGDVTLADLLRDNGLELRADLLTPWARWITPDIEPRRYDTFFFVALLADGGQRADAGDHSEADAAAWFTPDAALAAAREGTTLLLPPTAVCLGQIAAGGSVSAILSHRPAIRPLQPEVAEEDGQIWLAIPDEVEYPL